MGNDMQQQRAWMVYQFQRDEFIAKHMDASTSDATARMKFHAAQQAWSDGIDRGEIGAPAELFLPQGE